MTAVTVILTAPLSVVLPLQLLGALLAAIVADGAPLAYRRRAALA